MCGRFTQTKTKEEVAEVFGLPNIPDYAPRAWSPTDAPGRFNVAPTQDVLIIRHASDGPRGEWMRWGLVPPGAKDLKGGARMINARSETIFDKPVFKTAAARRRCLVPADGFFEWRREQKQKQPFYIRTNGETFAMAGLYERWKAPSGDVVQTFTILTCPPNALVAELHDRMPVILPKDAWPTWLDRDVNEREALEQLLGPLDSDRMTMSPVQPVVNSVKNDEPACIAPLTKPQMGFGFDAP
jgi:putative SOS response-associated peptidase YedK